MSSQHRYLAKGECIQKGDEYLHALTKEWTQGVNGIGEVYDPKRHVLYRRLIQTPQWQTGPIPDPDGPAVLFQQGHWFPSYLAGLDPNNHWKWYSVKTREVEDPALEHWFIQAITLPQ